MRALKVLDCVIYLGFLGLWTADAEVVRNLRNRFTQPVLGQKNGCLVVKQRRFHHKDLLRHPKPTTTKA